MKKLVLAATFFAAMFSQKAQAQDYYHGIGAQALFGSYGIKGDLLGQPVDETEYKLVPSIMYKATLGFELSRRKHFAVSAYPCIGFNYESNEFGSSSYFGYQLPILGELYLGDIDDQNFNIGLGLSYGSISYDAESNGSVFGPIINVGGQLEVKDQLLGFRASYTYGLNSDADIKALGLTESRSMIGLSVYYVLGQ